jgi:hypothetical protein
MLEFVFRLSQLRDSQADFYRRYEGRHDFFESHRGAFERRLGETGSARVAQINFIARD